MPHQLLTIAHHVARITLHHPPANVLNLAVLKELEQVLSEVEEDEYVQVVIVTGTGRVCCSWAVVVQPHRAVGETGSRCHQRHLRRRRARTGLGLPHSGGGSRGFAGVA